MTSCQQTYPGPMVTFKTKIEKLVLDEIEEDCCPKVMYNYVKMLKIRIPKVNSVNGLKWVSLVQQHSIESK